MTATVLFPFLLSFASTATPIPAATSAPQPAALDKESPPGMVLIKGGRTHVGSTKEDIEKLLESEPDFLRAFDAETPQVRVKIDDFHYGVTEVTNEQYREFVQATGYQAPRAWAQKAVDEASKAFRKAEGERRVAARESGKQFVRREFDSDAWWKANATTAEWEMPEEDALRPVGYVSYADAQAYCAWAGLRLPTEEEFQRAVRGDKKNAYPWGEDWKSSAAATTEIRNIPKGVIVGSLKDGVSKDGLFDLIGNFWEWTTSPYSPYKGYKPQKYDIPTRRGKKKETVEVDFQKWDANKRVVVGGSFQAPAFAARATTRRETDRTQRTNGLGFRCAATPRIGVDIATSVLEFDARRSRARARGTEFAAEAALVTDRWDTKESSSKEAPEGYAVISSYEYFMWMPVSELEHSSKDTLARASRTEPVQLGFFSTTVPLEEPALAPGTYFVSYRGKGRDIEDKDKKEEKKGPSAQEEGETDQVEVDQGDENFLLFDGKTGELVLTIPIKETEVIGVSSMKVDKLKGSGSIEFVDEKVWETPAGGGDPVQVTEKHVVFNGTVSSGQRNRGVLFKMQFKPDQTRAKASGWRK